LQQPSSAPVAPKARRFPWGRLVAAVLILALVACEGVAVYTGWVLTHPKHKAIKDSPANYGLTFEAVTFTSREDGLHLQGWYLPATAPSTKTVVIAHGFQGNREETGPGALNVAKDLVQNGYNALLFDFRDSGESEGDKVTVGYLETRDLEGAVDFVRSKGAQKVALLGYSMGASTAMLVGARMPEVNAVVADSGFSALSPFLLENAKHFTKLPDFPFTYLIWATVPPVLGANLSQVSPMKEMGALAKKPLFIIHGDKDDTVNYHHALDLMEAYRANGGQHGEVWIVPGAGHVKAYRVAPVLYKEKLLDFLGSALKG
jgi:fermentation-respiration switch protein FrsA (DUF1100 family)